MLCLSSRNLQFSFTYLLIDSESNTLLYLKILLGEENSYVLKIRRKVTFKRMNSLLIKLKYLYFNDDGLSINWTPFPYFLDKM